MLEAMRVRDQRFDGRFFVAVKTTGIYCRPVCPARPKPQNVEFFATAWEAEQEGFRACLRCRPETLPFSAAWSGTDAIVKRAVSRISAGGMFGKAEEEFATAFGVTARHLRRLFKTELGLTPKQLSDRVRLGFASDLLRSTALPVTDVAFAAGFASLRRFNAAFVEVFGRPPTVMRRQATNDPGDDCCREVPAGKGEAVVLPGPGITLYLGYRQPFDWHSALAYFTNHAVHGCEEILAGGVLRRYFLERPVDGEPKVIRIDVSDQPGNSRLKVVVLGADAGHLFALTRRIRAVLDLDMDPAGLVTAFKGAPAVRAMLRRYPGLRPIRGWDPFEVAVNTVMGQFVSMSYARDLNRQLTEGCGIRVKNPFAPGELVFLPEPGRLAAADLGFLKTTGRRRDTVKLLSAGVAAGRIALTDDAAALPLQRQSLDETEPLRNLRESLLAVPGIGPWTAAYIALRGLGDPDAFPGKDLVLARMVGAIPGLDPGLFRPWRGYLAICLWHMHAEKRAQRSSGVE